MMLMLIGLKSWLQQPKVWEFVCFVSCIVGLFCYALSPTFNDIFGKWSWWKILLYIVVSSIICLAVLFTMAWEGSTSHSMKANIALLVLMITCVYSFFFDKVVKGKPDAYSLVSCAAFAIMCVSLSRLSHCGFEVDLLHFFCALLTMQLMKIKLWLVIVGGSFSYSLIKLRHTLDVHVSLLRRDHELQVVDADVESGSLISARSSASQSQVIMSHADVPLENEDLAILPAQVGSDSQDPDNRKFDSESGRTERELAQGPEQRISASIELISSASPTELAETFEPQIIERRKETTKEALLRRFTASMEALKKKNDSVISMISKHVDTFLKANLDDKDLIPVPQRDDNLVMDALQSDNGGNILHNLVIIATLMKMAGLQEECFAVYCSQRREFLKESLSTFGLLVREIDNRDKAECWFKALIVAVRILFPNERRLCDNVFGIGESSDFAFAEVCTEFATFLVRTVDAFANLFPRTLKKLIFELEILFSGQYNNSFLNDARKVCESLDRFKVSESVLTDCGHGLLPITLKLITRIRGSSMETIYGLMLDLDKMLSPSEQDEMIRQFENSLKANSENFKNPALGYVFILNNRSYIDRYAVLPSSTSDFSWLRRNKTEIEKYLKLYQGSWTKILNILKLDILKPDDMDESESSVAAVIMTDKLLSFNKHFEDICNDQSKWFLFDKELRKRIIKSIQDILLPAYGNLIGSLLHLLGNNANAYIKYAIFDIEDRLNNLFPFTEQVVFVKPQERNA